MPGERDSWRQFCDKRSKLRSTTQDRFELKAVNSNWNSCCSSICSRDFGYFLYAMLSDFFLVLAKWSWLYIFVALEGLFFNCLLHYVLFTFALILAAKNLSNPIKDGIDQLPETRGIHSDTMKLSTFKSQDDVGCGVVQDLPLDGNINQRWVQIINFKFMPATTIEFWFFVYKVWFTLWNRN